MQKITKSVWLGPVISAFLTFVAICQVNFFISWICYIPLFISINNASAKGAFKRGFVFGLVFSSAVFFWMIPGAERFTGKSIFYGMGVFLISVIFFSLYHAAVLFFITSLKKTKDQPAYILTNCLLVASFFCVGEALFTNVLSGLPWFDIHSGTGLAANSYSIQPASTFGLHILTFIVILVNYLLAWYIAKQKWKQLYIPATVIVLYMITGFLLLQNFESKSNNYKAFKVAILSGNIPPEMKWDNNTGNFLVQKLLDLNRSALALKPNMALWSESAIPWTYKKDDDLVKEILSVTAPARVVHILGINTAYRDNIVFNSAYCILPGGEVTSRYDKQYLLSLIEKPMNGLLMPFFSSGGFSAMSNKQHAAPLITPYGKAGMLICNEATIPAAAANMVKQGAQFLFNISNDGWFDDTYIVRMHFYYGRIRAVETRKDLAINSNNGYSGLIKASGAIVEQERSEDPIVEMVSMHPNDVVTPAVFFPYIFVYCCAAFLVIIGMFNLIKMKS